MNTEAIKLINDIKEHKRILEEYERSHYLDRNHAISALKKKRLEDNKVAKATVAELAVNVPVPFEKASDEALAQELRLQIYVMESELVEMGITAY